MSSPFAGVRGAVAVALVLAFLAPLVVSFVGESQELGEDVERFIALQKARTATVFIATLVEGYIVWEEMEDTMKQLGMQHPYFVRVPFVGSGFFVSPDGYIITNGHVINDFESDLEEKMPLIQTFVIELLMRYQQLTGQPVDEGTFKQLFEDAVKAYIANRLNIQDYNVKIFVGLGKSLTGYGNIIRGYPARVIESLPAEREDLALIKIDIKRAPSLVVSREDIAKVGDPVYAIGYPAVLHNMGAEILTVESLIEPTITEGTVSGYRMKVSGVRVLQADVEVHGGNSGGPLVNEKGIVVGVTSFGISDPFNRQALGYNFFIPPTIVWELMSRNGVDNTPDIVMQYFEEGLKLYYQGHYSAAIERFRLVKDLFAGFPYVDDYIAESQAAIARGEDKPLQPEIFGINAYYLGALMLAVIASGGVAGFYIYKRRRSAGSMPIGMTHTPPPPPPDHMVQGQARVYGEQHVAQQTHGAVAGRQMQTLKQGEPGEDVRFCWNCGRQIPVDSRLCPYCGIEQED